MKVRLPVLGALCLAFALTGCATRTQMPFQNDADRLTEKSKPVFLMTATIKNAYRTSFQPKLLVVNVEKPEAKEAADRLNFVMDDKARNETGTAESGNTYLLRLELEPGHYEIRGLTSLVSSFPINGFFFAPMHSPLESKEPGVFYLGHVAATVRERQGEEFKAGPSLPLLDQAVAGASGGTFEIEITDQFATDEAVFRSKFPPLADAKITKAILPGFDRAKAQKWWEAH
ncbi:hypothetical protein [Variovorax saccharolyticus]|uniref:hypothetical protein n=1 Tax=Variovorax saccharolyticus TaxID=3053516 RepID=UPI002578E3C3|nr:hypothetical protein [Variovorax sp. J31P216]MDM0025751.1 hypothetical protein [Variovorax sp. J31P216]